MQMQEMYLQCMFKFFFETPIKTSEDISLLAFINLPYQNLPNSY